MDNEEMKQEIHEMKIQLEVIAEAVADQKVAVIRLMSHQQAHLAAIRALLVRLGEDKTKLDLSIPSAYETALAEYADQLRSFQKSGDINTFLHTSLFPRDLSSN
jgi:hypothetical protein